MSHVSFTQLAKAWVTWGQKNNVCKMAIAVITSIEEGCFQTAVAPTCIM